MSWKIPASDSVTLDTPQAPAQPGDLIEAPADELLARIAADTRRASAKTVLDVDVPGGGE